MITGFNMQNKCSKIESKGKHQGKDEETSYTQIIKIIHKTEKKKKTFNFVLSKLSRYIFELYFSFTVCPRIK